VRDGKTIGMNIKKMNFRYAANKREAAFTTFLLLSILYFFLTQGLIKSFMVPNLNAPIRAVVCDGNGCYAETERMNSKTRKIRITKQEYERFEFSSKVQIVLWSLYGVVLIMFRKYYYDRKRWTGIDGA